MLNKHELIEIHAGGTLPVTNRN